MPHPLDLQRLAVRIERLVATSRHGWHPGDDLEFQRLLPTSHDPYRLPDPAWLRDKAERDPKSVSVVDYQTWNQMMLRLETLAHNNHPSNPRRMMRDMARGKLPFGLR